MGVDQANISRDMFDEEHRYLASKLQIRVPLVDADWNDQAESLLAQIRRAVQAGVGDGAFNDGFEIEVATNNINNFAIKGGDGTDDGAGRFFLAGFCGMLRNSVDFATAREKLDFGTSTDLTELVLTDSGKSWTANKFIGGLLMPDAASPANIYEIIANDTTTITVKAGSTMLADGALSGDVYEVYKVKANLITPKNTGLTETVLSDTAANWVDDELIGRYLVPDITTPANSYQITDNDIRTITVIGGSEMLADGASIGDNYQILLTTPSGDREDAIYLDVFLDEIDTDEDASLLHSVEGQSIAACFRIRLEQRVWVREDVTTHGEMSDFLDADGKQHYLIKLSTLERLDSNNTITLPMTTDERPVTTPSDINTVGGVGPDASGNISFEAGPGIEIDFDLVNHMITISVLTESLGTGAKVFKQILDYTMQFRTLRPGTNITLDEYANEIFINSTGGPGLGGFASLGYYSAQTATGDQTEFVLSNFVPAGEHTLWIFLNGVRQTRYVDYDWTDDGTDTTVTFTEGLIVDDGVVFLEIQVPLAAIKDNAGNIAPPDSEFAVAIKAGTNIQTAVVGNAVEVSASGIGGGLGAMVAKSVNTDYVAATDGFVICTAIGIYPNYPRIQIIVNAVTIAKSWSHGWPTVVTEEFVSVPVKKDDTWRAYVYGHYSSILYWIPFGA